MAEIVDNGRAIREDRREGMFLYRTELHECGTEFYAIIGPKGAVSLEVDLWGRGLFVEHFPSTRGGMAGCELLGEVECDLGRIQVLESVPPDPFEFLSRHTRLIGG